MLRTRQYNCCDSGRQTDAGRRRKAGVVRGRGQHDDRRRAGNGDVVVAEFTVLPPL